jgi:cytochrome c-type biogenesis protein CcmH/NrfG
MASLNDYKEDFVLLLEAGFVAIEYMDGDGASKLFQGALLLNPEHSAPKIGLAAVAIHKLETKKSNQILEEILAKEPQNYRAAALLGISYILSATHVEKAEHLLKEAMTKADDPATRRLGELWIQVLEKGVRKSDAPAYPKKPRPAAQ